MKIEGIIFEDEVTVEEKTLKEGGVSVQVEELFSSTATPDNPNVWVFSVKQENVPSWFNAEEGERRFRDAIGVWWTDHVLEDKEIEELNSGLYRLEKCKVKRLRGDVRAILSDTKIDHMYDNSYVFEMLGDAYVGTMHDNTYIDDMCDDTVVGCMMGNSCIEDASGFAVVEEMHGNACIKEMEDRAKVHFMHDHACVNYMHDDTCIELMNDDTCIRTMSDNSYVCTAYNGRINKMQKHAIVMSLKVDDISDISDRMGEIKDCAIVRIFERSRDGEMKILTSGSAAKMITK